MQMVDAVRILGAPRCARNDESRNQNDERIPKSETKISVSLFGRISPDWKFASVFMNGSVSLFVRASSFWFRHSRRRSAAASGISRRGIWFRRRLNRVVPRNVTAILQLEDARGDDFLAGIDALGDRHQVAAGRAGCDELL